FMSARVIKIKKDKYMRITFSVQDSFDRVLQNTYTWSVDQSPAPAPTQFLSMQQLMPKKVFMPDEKAEEKRRTVQILDIPLFIKKSDIHRNFEAVGEIDFINKSFAEALKSNEKQPEKKGSSKGPSRKNNKSASKNTNSLNRNDNPYKNKQSDDLQQQISQIVKSQLAQFGSLIKEIQDTHKNLNSALIDLQTRVDSYARKRNQAQAKKDKEQQIVATTSTDTSSNSNKNKRSRGYASDNE
ncbi:hypothetical protein C1645_746413, partial [Glomus cerebriforme]